VSAMECALFGRRPTSGFQGETPHISIVPARCGVLHRELWEGGREGRAGDLDLIYSPDYHPPSAVASGGGRGREIIRGVDLI